MEVSQVRKCILEIGDSFLKTWRYKNLHFKCLYYSDRMSANIFQTKRDTRHRETKRTVLCTFLKLWWTLDHNSAFSLNGILMDRCPMSRHNGLRRLMVRNKLIIIYTGLKFTLLFHWSEQQQHNVHLCNQPWQSHRRCWRCDARIHACIICNFRMARVDSHQVETACPALLMLR